MGRSETVAEPHSGHSGSLAVTFGVHPPPSGHPMSKETLVSILSQLEAELHRPEIRQSASRVHALLHADFEEVGRSGRHWCREAMVDLLLGESTPTEVVADRYAAAALHDDVVLLTYRAAHRQPDGSLTRHTLRSSLWVKVGGEWQLRFHQGTAAAEIW